MSAQCHFTWETKGPFKLTEIDAMTQISKKKRPTLNHVEKRFFLNLKRAFEK